ncbi:hypothetical protein LIA77_03665 [Sarocladium implicatum]|nr:hypothetical protein LIA77_03665 [Sarocladium implicatum]
MLTFKHSQDPDSQVPPFRHRTYDKKAQCASSSASKILLGQSSTYHSSLAAAPKCILLNSQYSGYHPACSQSMTAVTLQEPGLPETMILESVKSLCVKYTFPSSGSKSRHMSVRMVQAINSPVLCRHLASSRGEHPVMECLAVRERAFLVVWAEESVQNRPTIH